MIGKSSLAILDFAGLSFIKMSQGILESHAMFLNQKMITEN